MFTTFLRSEGSSGRGSKVDPLRSRPTFFEGLPENGLPGGTAKSPEENGVCIYIYIYMYIYIGIYVVIDVYRYTYVYIYIYREIYIYIYIFLAEGGHLVAEVPDLQVYSIIIISSSSSGSSSSSSSILLLLL